MKHSLGKIICFCFCFALLRAEDFSYTFSVDKTSPYVKEAVILTLDLNQTEHDKVLIFDFSLKKSEDYTFQRLDIKETDTGHNAQVHYVYLLYPLKSGKVNIHFKLIKKVTSKESVAYSFSGDRDNVKGIVTFDNAVILDPVVLEVKPLPLDTALVGDFTLEYKIPKHQAQAYEPLPFQVSIEGRGYPPLLKSILPKEGNFTRFTEDPLLSSIASIKGKQNKVTYPMALSHSKSFTLPTIVIKAFNPQTHTAYDLTIPEQHFDISQVAMSTLVDKVNTPKPWKTDWSWFTTLMGYLLVFAVGYLSSLSWKWSKNTPNVKRDSLIKKIQNTKNEKALLQLLMATKQQDFSSSIEKLERSLYGTEAINLKRMKQKILEQIQ